MCPLALKYLRAISAIRTNLFIPPKAIGVLFGERLIYVGFQYFTNHLFALVFLKFNVTQCQLLTNGNTNEYIVE